MKIPLILNEEKTIIDAAPDEKLIDVLRSRNLISIKKGCEKGRCGSCTILLGGDPVPSCLIPVGIVRDNSITTLEHFLKTKAGSDITKGFAQAGINMCGYCNSARIFMTYSLLEKSYRPSTEELEELADSISCTCTDRKTFINGVYYATAFRHQSENRKNI